MIDQVSIGTAGNRLPTQRQTPESGDSPDPDDELTATPDDVEAVLGFDPATIQA